MDASDGVSTPQRRGVLRRPPPPTLPPPAIGGVPRPATLALASLALGARLFTAPPPRSSLAAGSDGLQTPQRCGAPRRPPPPALPRPAIGGGHQLAALSSLARCPRHSAAPPAPSAPMAGSDGLQTPQRRGAPRRPPLRKRRRTPVAPTSSSPHERRHLPRSRRGRRFNCAPPAHLRLS